MKRSPDGLGPIISVDRRIDVPLYQQVFDGYRDAVLDGRLRPGQRVPATRTLARDLAVSRMAVVMAFEQLTAHGYFEGRTGAGTFVAQAVRRRDPQATPANVVVAEPWLECWGPFRVGQPALDQFPAAVWGRLVAQRARMLSRREMGYGDPMGFMPLREALADLLGTLRSVRCSPHQIMIVNGSQLALALAARALIEPGDAVWMEAPGYPGARDALALTGAKLISVPVDSDGLDVDAALECAPHARAAYVTPSHQYPLGAILGMARRHQLLAWAHREDAWIIEDDYDSEFHYDHPRLPSLQGLDASDRVVYVGTFSKVLFPALRLGYVVIPPALIARFQHVRAALDNFPTPLYQAVVHDFIRGGHHARHVRRMQAVYTERRQALVHALQRELRHPLRIRGDRSGMHVVVGHAHDREIGARAARQGLSVLPLSSCYADATAESGLVLGYGATPARELPDAVRRLARVLRE